MHRYANSNSVSVRERETHPKRAALTGVVVLPCSFVVSRMAAASGPGKSVTRRRQYLAANARKKDTNIAARSATKESVKE